MTPKSTLAAAEFLKSNTGLRLSADNKRVGRSKQKLSGWVVSWDQVRSTLTGFIVTLREIALTHAELEQLARSIGWKGEEE
jgi:hypothetical protein